MIYPPWALLHIPHDSTHVPSSLREQFVLDDSQLGLELISMTDGHTMEMFAPSEFAAQAIRAPVSRLVVDVERFVDDNNEAMAKRGMGCIYTVTSKLKPLRRSLSTTEREALIKDYYFPHHACLEQAVSKNLAQYGGCCVLDCHSFPNKALPYELSSSDSPRVDICIGTDDYHTSDKLTDAFVTEFENTGFSVSINDPFAGALVPMTRYKRDSRVSAIMIEVNRALYMDETTGERLPEFDQVAQTIRNCCIKAFSKSDLIQQ